MINSLPVRLPNLCAFLERYREQPVLAPAPTALPLTDDLLPVLGWSASSSVFDLNKVSTSSNLNNESLSDSNINDLC